MCGILRHTGSGVPDVDSHRTTRGYLAGIAATGATRDEEQKEQCSEPPGGSVGAWQSPTEKQPRNPVEEGTGRMRSSTECNPEGRQRGDVVRTMRGLRESVAAHPPDHGGTGLEDDTKQPHSSLVHWETTGRDRTPCVSKWTGSMMMEATPQQSLYWECSTCSTTTGHGCDVRLVDKARFEDDDENILLIGEDETSCLRKCRGS